MKNILSKVGYCLLSGLLLLSLAPALNAQVVDTLSLPEINISANRFDVADVKLSTIIQRYDVNEIPEAGFISAGDVLNRNSRYVVRTYGPGQAQTAGSIGFNSSQVKVLWNGIELNHPMLGLVDLSLFPAVLLDEISVDNHLGSSEYGSSAIGGTVLMESGIGSIQKTSAEMNFGSFNSKQYSITTNGSIAKWSYSIGLVNTTQENDFVIDLSTGTSVKRYNADKDQFTGLGSTRYTGDSYWGDLSVWLSIGETGSPGSVSFPSTAARQNDRSFRVVHRSNWIHSDAIQSQLVASFNRIGLDYSEPAFSIESVSDVDMYNLSYGVRIKPSQNYQIRVRTGFDLSNINSTNFIIDNASRYYFQVNGLLTLVKSLNLYPSLRFDSYSEFDNAISYGLGLNYELVEDKLFALANINQNYAPPTFNDLYWPGFGNPDLEPETSIKSDIGLRYQLKSGKIGLNYFYSSIDNGILWWSDATGSFSPNNVNELRSTGVTADFEANFRFGSFSSDLMSSVTWLNAEYDMRAQDGSLQGNRVVYSPEYRANTDLRLNYGKGGVSIIYNYTSHRSVNDFNSQNLEAVHLINMSAFYTFETRLMNVRFTGTLQNITDETYQLIYDYPMPGINWNIGVRLDF